ncbi:MAG: glycosyltransferase family 2 protein [Microcoleaceae cyanobacterium]
MPVYNTPESFLREAIESVLNQVYPYWELCIADDASTASYIKPILQEYQAKDHRIKVNFRSTNGHISATSNSALELATGEYIALLDHDDILTPDALYEVVSLLNQHPEADMIYSDEDKLDENNQFNSPFFKPDWCPDSFLSRMYTCHLGVYRRELINQIGGFRIGYEGSQDYDLVLRFTEKTDKIFHIPKILYHWRVHSNSAASGTTAKPYAYQASLKALQDAIDRRGEAGTVQAVEGYLGHYLVRYKIKDYKKVSIIIPTRDLAEDLDRCLTSIFTQSSYPNYEVILIDNGSVEQQTHQVITKWNQKESKRFKSYILDIPFNYSKLNNYGVRQVTGEYLLFLNNDTEVITSDWIEAMVEQVQRPSIGAVGALLLFPDDTIQHAGVVMGLGGVAGHSYYKMPSKIPGYFGNLLGMNNVSAVTAACLMCRREVFENIGGFDEELAIAYNDIDFCLKIRKLGYQNIFLPHVTLYHHESKSRKNYQKSPEKRKILKQEFQLMEERWQDIIYCDPCYNPNLTKSRPDYTVAGINDFENKLLAISLSEDQEAFWGCGINFPQVGEFFQAKKLEVKGWVIGKTSTVIEVEFVCEGELIQKASVNQLRTDIAEAFPQVMDAENSGFIATVEIDSGSSFTELILFAILENDTKIPFATLHLQVSSSFLN